MFIIHFHDGNYVVPAEGLSSQGLNDESSRRRILCRSPPCCLFIISARSAKCSDNNAACLFYVSGPRASYHAGNDHDD